jgi:glycosyltransferase involved in cell wall biosynthesis
MEFVREASSADQRENVSSYDSRATPRKDMKLSAQRTSARLSETINLNNRCQEQIPRICLPDISIIIPVRNNQNGIDRFLETFFATHNQDQYPKEIIIVDNNSDVPVKLKRDYMQKQLPIRLQTCLRRGPAAARNLGVNVSVGKWLLFCDSDCIPTPSFLTGYLASTKEAVAYAGNVKGTPATYVAKYYDDEETLVPYRKYNASGESVPLYIVTANSLVWKRAFNTCGKFDELFRDAGGEDVDLGIRLWQFGNIEYVPDSLILHDFSDGLVGLCKRFRRYGRGNRQLDEATGISMRPHLRHPKRRTIFNRFAMVIQYSFMSIGYYGHKYRIGSHKKDGNVGHS